MTEEQKKAIDACKDQAAQELSEGKFKSFEELDTWLKPAPYIFWIRAMQLYGEQCRKEEWINVGDDILPAKGDEILMLCPKEDGKGFYHCVGFYARWRQCEADVEDDDVPGIDYDVESGIAWITEGFYEEEEQYRGEFDTHYMQRYPVKWRKLTAQS